VFAGINLAVTALLGDYETVPFHLVWVSLTIVCGLHVWRLRTTMGVLAAVSIATGVTLGWVVLQGPQGPDELTEVPLMAAMFLAMVWHAHRGQGALEDVRRAADREREFVRDASHQLKTPIAIARGLASLVRDAPGSPDALDDMTDLVAELDRLSRITEELLLLAAAEQQDGLLREAVDFEDVLVAAARRWSRTADRAWRASTCEGELDADRQRVDSALDAIIENAVAATDDGDSISVVGRSEGHVAVIEVSDSGVGIPQEALPRVFDRFWQIEYGRTGRRGSGLGLAIVKAIVEAHGGTVSVSSGIGRGTCLTMRLPGFRPTPVVAETSDLVFANGRRRV
jgi:signal transduction histidine kinase